MALFRPKRKPCLALILFLISNPHPGLLARGNTSNMKTGSEGKYRWKNRGCMALLKSVFNNVNINPAELLAAFPVVEVDSTGKVDTIFNRIVEFAHANPDKVKGAASVAALMVTACLLYSSIQLTYEIGRLFNQFKELRGQFDVFVNSKLPKIEGLFVEIQKKTETGSVPGDKEYRRVEWVLLQYYKEVADVLEKVRDLIEQASMAQWDAQLTAALSFVIAAAAGVAVISDKVPMSGLATLGTGVVACAGTTAGVLSLMNANDCKVALREMRVYKKELEDLKSHAWDMMLDIKIMRDY